MPKAFTREEIITRIKAIHGNKIIIKDDEFIYKNTKNKVKVYCGVDLLHGSFEVVPGSLIGKTPTGCPTCGHIKTGLSKRLNTSTFVALAEKVHGDKYDYTGVKYITSNTLIKIKCKNGHEIEVRPILYFSKKY